MSLVSNSQVADSQPPPAVAAAQHHPIMHHPDAGIADRLRYLREHRVCERLELMVRGLIAHKPADPVLSLCALLKEADRSLGFAGRAQQVEPFAGGAASDLAGAPPSQSTARAGSSRGGVAGVGSVTSAMRGSPSLPNSPSSFTSGWGNNNSMTNTNTIINGKATTQSSTGPAAAAPSAGSSLPPLAVRHNSTLDTGRSVATPSVTSGRLQVGGGNNTTGRASALDRDESARSDMSLFSVQSVDMGEFLSEFRAAHHALFGGARPRISFQDLADIVDRVSVPLPDTNMLSALFCEMESLTASGLVVFEGFLSRMAQRIQGHFTSENLAGVFLQLASQFAPSSSEHAAASGGQLTSNPLSSSLQYTPRSSNAPSPTVFGANGAAASRPTIASGGGGGGGALVVDAAQQQLLLPPSSHFAPTPAAATATSGMPLARPSSSAASTEAALVAHSTWVPSRVCLDQGMQALGMRMEETPAASSSAATTATTTTTSSSATSAGGGANWSIHDFLRVVNGAVGAYSMPGAAATGGGGGGFRTGSMSNFASVTDLTAYYNAGDGQ